MGRKQPFEEMRLRVLLCTNSADRGGAEEHMLVLLRGLDRSQFDLHLACPPQLPDRLPDLPRDVQVFAEVPRRARSVGAGMALAGYIRRCGIDLVHAHLSCSARAVAPWARLGGARAVIATPHVREGWRHGWKAWYGLDRAFDVFLDGYIAVSGANAAYLTGEKRLQPEKVWTIRNGIDLTRFGLPEAGADPRPEWGIRPSERLLVCVARLEPQKGHTVLFEAMARMGAGMDGSGARGGGVRLVCLGDGRLATELRQQAQTLGLKDRIIFVGECRRVADWLAVADVFVLPSLYEGLPLSAIEASAAGCPIVATAVDGTPEIVQDGVNGLLVPAGDAEALAAALQRLLADARLRQHLAANGPRIAAGFDRRGQVSATAALYCRLADQAAGVAGAAFKARHLAPAGSEFGLRGCAATKSQSDRRGEKYGLSDAGHEIESH